MTDPETLEERKEIARRCREAVKFAFTTVADTMDDAAAVAYAAWPERLFVVDPEGKVVYAGRQGPLGFYPVKRIPPYGGGKGPFGPVGPSLEEFLEGHLK